MGNHRIAAYQYRFAIPRPVTLILLIGISTSPDRAFYGRLVTMPNMSNLVLVDRATTPANHTFVPRGKIGADGGRLVEAGVSAIADSPFTIEPRVTPAGRRKVKLTLSRPVVQTKVESGVTSYIPTRVNRVMMEFDFAPDATDQERKDIIGMIASALPASQTMINAVLVNLENIF